MAYLQFFTPFGSFVYCGSFVTFGSFWSPLFPDSFGCLGFLLCKWWFLWLFSHGYLGFRGSAAGSQGPLKLGSLSEILQSLLLILSFSGPMEGHYLFVNRSISPFFTLYAWRNLFGVRQCRVTCMAELAWATGLALLGALHFYGPVSLRGPTHKRASL